MFIITKTTVAARPVSLEQIAAMVITRQRLRLINSWRCHNCCTSLPKNRQNSNKTCNFRIVSMNQRQQFFAIGLIGLILIVSGPAFVTAASKTYVRSIASHENDPHRLHANWLEYQRQSVQPRTQNIQPHYLSPDFGNIFSQLGFFIQSRQRNATELAEKIFFKYYNT